MAETIHVDAVVEEKTYVGKVEFPVSVPQSLVDWLDFPKDLMTYGGEMGLGKNDVKFLLGALRGKWGLTAVLDLPDLSHKIGLTFAEMDEIVRGLVDKNYARINERLELYRFWIVLLHVKGIRFDVGH
jgi:hypothetical protein